MYQSYLDKLYLTRAAKSQCTDKKNNMIKEQKA